MILMACLTISIITQNNREYIDRCLASIFANTGDLAFEVLVTDNGSEDGTQDLLNRKYPNVHLIPNRVPHGFSENHNRVLRATKAEYACLLNDDTIVGRRAMDAMVGYLDSHQDTAVAGCRLVYPDHSFQLSFGPIPSVLSELLSLFTTSKKYHQLLTPYFRRRFSSTMEVGWVTGAALFVRREPLEQVSFLDEEFVAYYEDVDLCYRIGREGWRVVYTPCAEIIHYRGVTRSQDITRNLYLIYESREKFFLKHFGRNRLQRLRVATSLELLARIIVLTPTVLAGSSLRKKNAKRLQAYAQILSRTVLSIFESPPAL